MHKRSRDNDTSADCGESAITIAKNHHLAKVLTLPKAHQHDMVCIELRKPQRENRTKHANTTRSQNHEQQSDPQRDVILVVWRRAS